MATSSTGAASFVYRVPVNHALLGGALRMQWAVVDPSANVLGVALSPGGVAIVGDF